MSCSGGSPMPIADRPGGAARRQKDAHQWETAAHRSPGRACALTATLPVSRARLAWIQARRPNRDSVKRG